MFTVTQIKEAHSKVKSGADFPKYIQQIKGFALLDLQLGLKIVTPIIWAKMISKHHLKVFTKI